VLVLQQPAAVLSQASLEQSNKDVQRADWGRSRRWLTVDSAMGVDSRKNGGCRTCQREQKTSWSPGGEAGEVEITLGVCGEMPGPVRSTRSSFVFARHANDTRRASLLCLQPPPAVYGLRRMLPVHVQFFTLAVVATKSQRAVAIIMSPGQCRGVQASS
ncbi:hypothetical protein TUN199_07469, partial [Pyrenophora tritici-repentis]